jgi:site-specific DNA recombinase
LSDSHIYRDDGYSGAELNRPGLDSLRDHANMGTFKLVLITEPDRLARKYVHQLLLLEEIEKNGCGVEFLDRPMSKDPHDQLLLQIRGAVAEYERSLIAERMRRGRRMKMKTGQLLSWTIAPYGYILDVERPSDPARVRIDTVKAEFVKQIFVWYTDCKNLVSLREIAKRLNKEGIPTASGKNNWNSSTVRNILRSEAYAGTAYCNRRQSVPARYRRSPLEPIGSGRSYKLRIPEEWIPVSVPAIISKAIFDAAQERLNINKWMSSRNNKVHEYLLRSLVSCGYCKLSCTARFSSPKHSYYVCRSHQKGKGESCGSPYFDAEILDRVVWEDLCLVLNSPELIAHELERAQSGQWLPQELQARKKSITAGLLQLERQQSRLLEVYLAEIIGREEFDHKRQELKQNQEGLHHQLRQLEIAAQTHVNTIELSENIQEFCNRIVKTLNKLEFNQRRHLIELLIDRVIVYKEEVEIRYVIPTSPKGEKTIFCHLRKNYFRRYDTNLVYHENIYSKKFFKRLLESIIVISGASIKSYNINAFYDNKL